MNVDNRESSEMTDKELFRAELAALCRIYHEIATDSCLYFVEPEFKKSVDHFIEKWGPK